VGRLDVIAVGEVDGDLVKVVGRRVAEVLGLEVVYRPPLPAPDHAWDQERRQHASTAILRAVLDAAGGGADRVLAIADVDLFIPMLTFVFGQAQLEGPAALISVTRLRQEYYGLPPNRAVFLERACREALHELGHTFGLVHCPETHCCMSLSHTVRQIDTKDGGFCPGCRGLMNEQLAGLRAGGGRPGAREEMR
jgi:archaemetzincin